MVESMFVPRLNAIAAKVVELAEAGDLEAARIVLDRICPVPRGAPVHFRLPPGWKGDNAADLTIGVASLLRDIAGGKISPAEAVTVATVFARAMDILPADGGDDDEYVLSVSLKTPELPLRRQVAVDELDTALPIPESEPK